nr:hypothetical protein [Fusobacterium varium]
MEHSKTGFIISITRGFVAIVPAVLLLSYIFGMTGVWLSFPMAEIFALFSVIYFIYSNRSFLKINLSKELSYFINTLKKIFKRKEAAQSND